MATAADRDVEILIRTTADPTGAVAIGGALKEVQAQGVAAGAAIAGSWERLAAATGQNVAQLKELAAANKAAAAISSSSVGGASASAQELAIQGQINAVLGTRRELLEATILGNTEQTALLRNELAIRQQTLNTLRSETLTQDALNGLIADENALLALAAKQTEAVAAGGLLAGASLNKAKGEALVLGREFATGSVNARTMGALLGSLGNVFTIAAIAGFSVFEIIKSIRDESEKFNKELTDIDTKLSNEMERWRQLAILARNARDVGKLAGDVGSEIDQLETKLFDAQQQHLAWWKRAIDFIGTELQKTLYGTSDRSAEYFRQVHQREIDAIQNRLIDLAKTGRSTVNLAQENANTATFWSGQPAAAAVVHFQEDIKNLTAERADLMRQLNELDLTDVKNLAQAKTLLGGIHEIDGQINVSEQEKNKSAEKFGQTTQQTAALLRQIRGEQQLIGANPYLSAEATRDLLHNAALREEAAILSQIGKIEADIAALKALGDPQQTARIEKLNAELDELRTKLGLLRLTIRETTAGGEFTADLSKWVNSFGTASHQIAQTIEGTINAALQGTNQLLIGAIFRTGDWRQTLQGVEQQILNLFLTMIEQMILQNTLGRALQTTSTAQSVASGGAVAAAYAPAAAATSISSFGSSAVIGEVLALAAIAAIVAALAGGFEEGGYTGNIDRRKPAGIVHGKEFVFTADETESLGVPFLKKLAAAAGGRARFPGYQSGGWVEPPDLTSNPAAGGGGAIGGSYVWVQTPDGLLTPMYVPAGTGYVNAGGYSGMFGSGSTIVATGVTIIPGGSVGGTPVQIFTDTSTGEQFYADPSGAGLVPVSLGSRSSGDAFAGVTGEGKIISSGGGVSGGRGPMSPYVPGTYGLGGLGVPLYSFGSGIGATTIFTGGAMIGGYSFPGMSAQTAVAVAGHIAAGELDALFGSGALGTYGANIRMGAGASGGAEGGFAELKYQENLARSAASAGFSNVDDYLATTNAIATAKEAAAYAAAGAPQDWRFQSSPWNSSKYAYGAGTGSWVPVWSASQLAILNAAGINPSALPPGYSVAGGSKGTKSAVVPTFSGAPVSTSLIPKSTTAAPGFLGPPITVLTLSSSGKQPIAIGSPGSGSGGLMSTDKVEIHVHNSDWGTAQKRFNESPSARKMLVRSVKRIR